MSMRKVLEEFVELLGPELGRIEFDKILGRAGAAGVGLGLMGQSEDADAGVITKGGKRIIEAFHGSPHKFDRFSMDAIGTGEGAQAYGHGLYFADSEDVAKQYRDALSPSSLPNGDSYGARTILIRKGDEEGSKLFREAYRKGGLGDDEIEAALQAARDDIANPQGALYRTHIDVDPDTLLDWDKPLSEQSESIQEAVKSSLVSRKLDEMGDDEFYSVMQNIDPNGVWSPEDQMDEFDEVLSKDDLIASLREYSPDMLAEVEDYLSADFDPAMSGASLYRQATAQRGGGSVMSNEAQAEVSRRLNEMGIPGIRYADGMSRGKDGGTYNYVMFDDKPISIVERGNASPEMLAATAGGTAAATGLLDPVFDALELPWKGYLGATRMAGGLLAGEGFDEALDRGVRQIRQPVEETADELGGAATDATGRPEIGTLAYLMTLLGGPI